MHSWQGWTETTRAWLQGAQADTCRDTQARTMAATAALVSEQQLVPWSLLPPCKGWDVPLPQPQRQDLCHVHSRSPAGPAWPPLSAAHAAEPCLLLCCCWLLQHLPPNIPTAPALRDLPTPNPSNCPAFSMALLQTLNHFS